MGFYSKLPFAVNYFQYFIYLFIFIYKLLTFVANNSQMLFSADPLFVDIMLLHILDYYSDSYNCESAK